MGKGPLSSLHSGKREWWGNRGDLECGRIIEKSSLSVAYQVSIYLNLESHIK